MVLLPIALTRIIRHGTANHSADACQVSSVAKQNVKLTGNITALVKCREIPLPVVTDKDQGSGTLCCFLYIFLKLINFGNEVHSSPILRF